MNVPAAPKGLGSGGRRLWRVVASQHDLDALQTVQLEEACRAKDRLDGLDLLLRGDVDTWTRLTHRTATEDYVLVVDDALAKANAMATLLKQLLAALRLPDEVTGRKPQQRGGARGAYRASGKASARDRPKVSSLDRARAAKAGLDPP